MSGESETSAPSRIEVIRREDYSSARTRENHIFLTGNLRRPMETPFFHDERLEWIVCRYQAGDNGMPHWHREVTEYEMILEGSIGYLEIATEETHWFQPGDFFRIPAGACVKRLVESPSQSLAVKVPSHAGKVHCEQCPRKCHFRIAAFAG